LSLVRSAHVRYKVLVHAKGDDVGIAVEEIASGEQVNFVSLDEGGFEGSIEALDPIPIGHKIALKEIPSGANVIEYGRPIGIAASNIEAGGLVHVHNIRSLRWGDKR